MSSYTLLDYVQTILSSLDSDEVNSYDDTVESLQVANILKTVYNDIQARADLPEHYGLFEIDASGDSSKPVLMYRPDEVSSILWIKYNIIEDGDTDPIWRTIKFKPIDQFMDWTYQLKVSEDNVETFDLTSGTSSLSFIYRNDKAPEWFTTFDDNILIFDSYDSLVDTTLQGTKTLAYGKKDQTFTLSNTFVPFLDQEFSTLLLNEAKVLAFSELKQVGHDIARQWANRGWTKVQKSKRGIDQDRSEMDRLSNYGRK